MDASVAAKWVVDEEHSDRAALLIDYDALFAPAHWRAEATNVLWSKVRCGDLTLAAAAERLDVLMRVAMQETPLSLLTRAAFDIATAMSITIYDALYVALAEMLAVPLVTADRRLIRLMEGRPAVTMRWIGSLRA